MMVASYILVLFIEKPLCISWVSNTENKGKVAMQRGWMTFSLL